MEEAIVGVNRGLEGLLKEGPFHVLEATVSRGSGETNEYYMARFMVNGQPEKAELEVYSRVSMRVTDVEIAEWLEDQVVRKTQKRRRDDRATAMEGGDTPRY